MKFLVMVKSDPASEGQLPSTELMAKMAKFNEELVKAGVMKAGEGLEPSASGARVSFRGGTPTVTDGPFTEARELVGGYWVWEAGSRDEAVAWAQKIPFVDGDVEIRRIAEPEHYAANDPGGKIAAREQRLREQMDTD